MKSHPGTINRVIFIHGEQFGINYGTPFTPFLELGKPSYASFKLRAIGKESVCMYEDFGCIYMERLGACMRMLGASMRLLGASIWNGWIHKGITGPIGPTRE